MKKSILLLAVVFLILSCSKDEDSDPKNILADTSWTAPDDIAKFLYGGNCTQTLEFFIDYKCQKIEKIEGSRSSDRVRVSDGVYELYSNNDSVRWTIGERTSQGRISGSVIITTANTLGGEKLTYTKN